MNFPARRDTCMRLKKLLKWELLSPVFRMVRIITVERMIDGTKREVKLKEQGPLHILERVGPIGQGINWPSRWAGKCHSLVPQGKHWNMSRGILVTLLMGMRMLFSYDFSV